MGRPKGSKNKSKGESPSQVDAPGTGPGAGHNQLTAEQRRKLLLQGVAKIEDLQEEMRSLSSAISKARKELKSEGFSNAQVNFALELRKDDKAEAQEKWRSLVEVAVFLNHPIGTQPDLLDGVDRTPAVDTAGEEGLMAGMEGKSCDPPYDQGTPQGQKWIAKWHDGQALKVRGGIKPLETAPPAAPDASQSFSEALPDAEQPDDGFYDSKKESATAH